MPAPAAGAAAKVLARRMLLRAAASREHRSHAAGCGCAAAVGAIVAVASIALIAGVAVIASPLGLVANSGPPAGALSTADPIVCPHLQVSQGYGDTPYEHPHTGIDLVCPAGTPVQATLPGVVRHRSGPRVACAFPPGATGGLGTYAELDHGDVAMLYGHLEQFAVVDGAQVVPGTIIGFEGSSGCSTGFHLHFEVHVAGRVTNPCSFLPQAYPAAHETTGDRCWGSAPP